MAAVRAKGDVCRAKSEGERQELRDLLRRILAYVTQTLGWDRVSCIQLPPTEFKEP